MFVLSIRRLADKQPRRKATYKPQLESLENREVMSGFARLFRF